MRNQLNELKPCEIHPGHFADYCITGFMKQMQCNVTPSLNIIKTTAKQVWLSQNYAARIHRHYHNPSDCFEYPKNLYLNQATQKNTCQIFLPKNIPEWKISTPPPPQKQNPSIITVTGSLEYPPWDLLASEKPQHLETRPVY